MSAADLYDIGKFLFIKEGLSFGHPEGLDPRIDDVKGDVGKTGRGSVE